MTDDVVTPEPAAPPTAPLESLPDGGQKIADPRAAALAAVLAKRASKESVATAATEPPPAPPAVVEPPKVEPPKQDDAALREARMLAQMQQRDRDVYETKQELAAARAALKAEEDAKARYRDNPFEALKAHGHTLESAVKGEVEGKYKAASAEQLAIESVKSEAQMLREEIDALKAERDQGKQQQQLAARVSEIDAVLKREDVAEKIPYLSSVPWAARHLAEWAAQNPGKDVDAYAIAFDANLAQENSVTFASDRALKRLLADEATKTRVMALLGITKQAPQPAQQAATGITSSGNGPSAIPSTAANEPGTRKTPSRAVTDSELRANAAKAVVARRAQRSA